MINKCPYCNTDLEENTEICPVCGSDLRMDCPYCKQKIRAFDRECPFCKTDLFQVTDKIIFYTGTALTALWVLGNLGFLLLGYMIPEMFAIKDKNGMYVFNLGQYFRMAFGILIPVVIPYFLLIYKDSKNYKKDSYMWLVTNTLIGIIFMICFAAIRTKVGI